MSPSSLKWSLLLFTTTTYRKRRVGILGLGPIGQSPCALKETFLIVKELANERIMQSLFN